MGRWERFVAWRKQRDDNYAQPHAPLGFDDQLGPRTTREKVAYAAGDLTGQILLVVGIALIVILAKALG